MHIYERKINYYETDKMGIVHHSNYIRFFEEARCSLLEEFNLPYDLMEEKGFVLGQNYSDLGHTIFSFEEESYQGGSGAGCSAVVLATYILDKLKDKTFSKVLLVATGALMSTITNQQGDSIPAIAHLVEIVRV